MRNSSGMSGLVAAALLGSGMLRRPLTTDVATVEDPKPNKTHSGNREKARRLKQMEKAALKLAQQGGNSQ